MWQWGIDQTLLSSTTSYNGLKVMSRYHLNEKDLWHFRRPLNRVPSGSTVQVQLHQRYFWNRQWSSFSIRCTEAEVISKTPIPVNAAVLCYVNGSSSTFPSGGVSTVMTTTDCDQNPLINSWSGERYNILTLPLTTSITIGYNGSAWFGPSLYPAAGLALDVSKSNESSAQTWRVYQ